MSVYQKRHYEDVAGLLRGAVEHAEWEQRFVDVLLVEDFADLFAEDNPIICTSCGDEKGTTSICTRPNEGHNWTKGFDRQRFLVACGLGENNA